MRKNNYITATSLAIRFILFTCITAAEIKYAGARSSYYGTSPFPTPVQWGNINRNMATLFEGSTPTAVWIVGGIIRDTDNNIDYCRLEFPNPGGEHDSIQFFLTDKHEPYLTYFDTVGVQVYLQVESGDADIEELIDLVLTQYGHHPCVVGFGIDVEWYLISQTPNTGTQVTDVLTDTWDKRIKSYNSNYKMFLKHWDEQWMPPTYRSDIVFINDSQGFGDVFQMGGEFARWAQKFNPNIVMFQIGYQSDYTWWQSIPYPPKDIGEVIVGSINDPSGVQEVGIIWVDFTLRNSEMLFLFENIDAIGYFITPPQQSSSLNVMYTPFFSAVKISYDLQKISDEAPRLEVRAINGSLIESWLLNCHKGTRQWNVTGCSSGSYIVNLRSNYKSCSQKIVVQKK